jgi:hypothetical protein
VHSVNFDFVKFCRFIFVISFLFPLLVEPIELLKNLDYENEVLKKLRSEVKYNLKVSKSKNNSDDYIPLEFYKYTVVQGDNFFRIMARTGMNIDTISSVNALSSPQDIRVGMTLLIPNMRGVYDTENLPENEHSRGPADAACAGACPSAPPR